MDSSNAALAEAGAIEPGPAALLRGTARGPRVVGRRSRADRCDRARARGQARRSADVLPRQRRPRSRSSGPLANDCLVALAELATRYDLRIVEVGAPKPVLPPAMIVDDAAPDVDGAQPRRKARRRSSSPMTKPLELAEARSPTPFEDEEPTLFLERELVVATSRSPMPRAAVRTPGTAARRRPGALRRDPRSQRPPDRVRRRQPGRRSARDRQHRRARSPARHRARRRSAATPASSSRCASSRSSSASVAASRAPPTTTPRRTTPRSRMRPASRWSSNAIKVACRATSPPASKESSHGSRHRHHVRKRWSR